mgnify:CR=1 FL=1
MVTKTFIFVTFSWLQKKMVTKPKVVTKREVVTKPKVVTKKSPTSPTDPEVSREGEGCFRVVTKPLFKVS